MRLSPIAALATLGFLLCIQNPAPAQEERAGWFPFVVPDLTDERTANSLVDLSALNPEPAGAHGFLRARGEQLVDDRGVPVRLFGSNITDYHAMPPKEMAPRIAERLRQLGINFIRLHYADWDIAPRGILNPDRQTLNPEKLDQWDFFIYHLKRCGIYVDINLHVARAYPGMPEGWHRFGKALDILHEPYIQSQMQYARDLIGHVNTYTGNSYANEPAVAFIEINNENTALADWHRYAFLPDRFSAPLQVKWNAWLRAKYRTTDALRAAWNGDPPRGPELLRNADLATGTTGWSAESNGGAQATLTARKDDDGTAYLRWDATKAGGENWHLQVMQTGVPVRHGKQYVIQFRARARAVGTLGVCLMQQQDPWRTVGHTVTLRLTPQWRNYSIAWVVDNPQDPPVRLNFTCNNQAGTYDLAALSLREGGAQGLGTDQSLEAGTVPLVGDAASRARATDYAAFLLDREIDYVRRMKRLLREELGARSLIFNTQVSYGGLGGLIREGLTGDAIDCHTYPAHPSQARDEKGTYWKVRNVSMLDGAYGALERLGLWRIAGKPFCVTEFDLNPPNDHAAETFPMLALMAAYQDWSAIADYSWYNFQQDYGHSRIRSHFATTGHAGQMAFVPAAALLYRLGLVSPAGRRAVLTLPEGDIPAALSLDPWRRVAQEWGAAGVATEDASWRQSVAVQLAPGTGPAKVQNAPATTPGPTVSDTGQITVDRTEKGRECLKVNAPAIRMLIGRTAGRRVSLGDVAMEVAKGTFRDYANIALVALDAKPIAQSRRLLLTTVARVENKGQQWNADRTSIVRDWGEGPTLAEPVGLTLQLPGSGWRARALDGHGQPTRDLPMAGSTLTTGGASVWYLIERN